MIDTQAYGIRHADECPSGDRAEQRGACTCGATDDRPWRVRAMRETDATERPLVEVQITRPLTTREAVELSLTLQELTRAIGERWGRTHG